MIDEIFVEECLPIVSRFAKQYENEYHSYEDLYSEGSLLLIEYIANENYTKSDLKYNIYRYIKRTLKKISKTIDTNIDYNVNIENVIVNPVKVSTLKLIHRAINELSIRERDIICRYYGFNTNNETLESIGKSYGITRSRVDQIKCTAERRIKIHLNRQGYDCGEIN